MYSRDRWTLAGLMLSTTLISAPVFYAIKTAGVGLGTSVMYAGIVVGAFFFGRLFNKEKYAREKWLATGLAFAGLWVLFSTSVIAAFGILALLAALLSGLASGLNMVMVKKLPYTVPQITLLTWLATVLSNLPLAIIFQEELPDLSLDMSYLYLLFFVISSLLASLMLIYGLKLVDAGTAGIYGLLEIVFGVMLGIALFGEYLIMSVALGITLIIMAAAIPYVSESKAIKKGL